MVNRAILFLLPVPTLMAQTKPDARRRFELASIKPNIRVSVRPFKPIH